MALKTRIREPEPLPKRPCYDFPQSDIVVKTTNQFVHKNFYNRPLNVATRKSFFLRNHLSATDIRVCRDDNLTIECLEDNFSQFGHCLAYNMAESYVTLLMLDFDCYKCKKGTCPCSLQSEFVEIIHDEVLHFVKDCLRNDNVKCVIFKNSATCNMHMYFNVSVSIIVLELMRKRLVNHLSSMITDKYLVDSVCMLDLPFSTKNGESIYKAVFWTENFDYRKLSCLPTESHFYDVLLKLNVDEVYEAYITLGKFSSTHSSSWNDDVEHVKYLLTPLDFRPAIVKNENQLIVTMKLGNVTNFNTSYNLLKEYFAPKEIVEYDDLNAMLKESDEFNEFESKIIKQLCLFGTVLSKKVYGGVGGGSDESSSSGLKNVLKFLVHDDANYAFYIISSVIMYLHSINQTVPVETCKFAVVKVLKAAIMCSSHIKNDIVIHILNSIEKFTCMQNMNSVFSNFDDWLKYLMNVARMEQFEDTLASPEKKVRLITTQLKVYESLESIYHDLVELCEMLIPLIKVEHGCLKTYYYVDAGVYVAISTEKFFSVSTVKIQSIERILRKTLDVLCNNNQVTPEFVEKVKMKDIWLRYFDKLPVHNPMFNFYDYFISTEIGVFNTLTGCYMAHTPLLHMNTQKKYCITPHVPLAGLTIGELNRHIMRENQSCMYSDMLDLLLKEQNKLFYGAVMMPGLLKLEDTLYNETQENDMLMAIFERIIDDQDMVNEQLLFFVEPLIVKYRLNIGKILNLAAVIQKNILALGTYTRVDIRRFCIANEFEHEDYDFQEKPDTTLYDQLSEEQSHRFNAKFFVLAVIMQVFDVAHKSILDPAVTSTNTDCSTLTISKLHLFYDIDRYSLSMKSYDPVKRVVEYLTCALVPDEMLNLIRTISTMLGRDPVSIHDFLNTFAMLYHHTSKRKKIVLLIGSPNSGKSTYQHMLVDMHGRSSFSMTSVVQAEGQGPSPEVVNALSNYLFSVIELKSMNSSTLKSMISGDVMHKRFLHQNEMIGLKPLSFAIAAANNLPNIYQADEAVRDRLAPFLFKVVYIDESQICNYIDDNTLLADVSFYMISNTQFQIAGIAREFANLLYHYFQRFRDSYGLLQPRVDRENVNSQNLINQILIKNNKIYYILNASDVVFNESLSISYEALEEAVAEQIELYKVKTTRTYNWSIFKNEVSLLFKNKELSDKSGIRGMGLLRGAKDTVNDEDTVLAARLLVKRDNETVATSKIRSYLYHVKHLPLDKIKNVMMNVRTVYAQYYDSELEHIKDHILAENGNDDE